MTEPVGMKSIVFVLRATGEYKAEDGEKKARRLVFLENDALKKAKVGFKLETLEPFVVCVRRERDVFSMAVWGTH